MLRVLLISSSGLAFSKIRSAVMPGLICPISSVLPKKWVGATVAAYKAWLGVMPPATSNSNSVCKLYPGMPRPMGVSVPAAIGTLRSNKREIRNKLQSAKR